MKKDLVAKNIRQTRERLGFSQQEVAKLMGWKSHTSLVAIENGSQEIKLWELLKLAHILKVTPESLYSETSDSPPLRPVILWRKMSANKTSVIEEERNIVQHCQDYQLLERLTTVSPPTKSLPQESCDIESVNVDWANQLADKIHRELRLGDYPAELLAKCLEEEYGVLLIARPLDNGSAACHRQEHSSVIVLNEKEVPWRQVFNLAHELFHLITWSPDLIEKVRTSPKLFQKNETLADAFAAALLMPQPMIDLDVRGHVLSYAFIMALAQKYHVSRQAMLLRLHYLRFISKATLDMALSDPEFTKEASSLLKKAFDSVQPLGQRFLRLAYLAYEKGRLSRARLAQMLGIKLRDVADFLAEKGFFPTDDKELETRFS